VTTATHYGRARLLACVLRAALVSFVLMGLWACAASPSETCAVRAAGFLEEANAVLLRWEEAESAARAASRDGAEAAIARLIALRDEAGDLDPPECGLAAKVSLVRYMDLTIQYHNALWAEECPACIEPTREQAEAFRERALEELAALSAQ